MKSSQQYADEFYKKFSKAEGNQHIASLFAIKKIIDVVRFNQPKNILEIGLGIGSISYSIIEFSKNEKNTINYYGTENNKFCLNQLPKNLEDNYEKIKLFSDLEKIPKNIQFDFIIIDGADESLEDIKNLMTENAVIFIEGDRSIQLSKVKDLFPNHLFVHTISNYKDPIWGPFTTANWSGGGKLIYINPTVRQKIHYVIEKIKTSYRNRITRKIFN